MEKSWPPNLSLKSAKLVRKKKVDFLSHRIHGAAIYSVTFTMNIPPMLAYIPYMDPMGIGFYMDFIF